MKCPNKRCGQETGRILVAFRSNRKTGKVRKVEGCPACFEHQLGRAVYSGRKIWVGNDAYGEKKVKQMNADWGEKLKERAARNRQGVSYVSPEAFEVISGKRPARGQFQ